MCSERKRIVVYFDSKEIGSYIEMWPEEFPKWFDVTGRNRVEELVIKTPERILNALWTGENTKDIFKDYRYYKAGNQLLVMPVEMWREYNREGWRAAYYKRKQKESCTKNKTIASIEEMIEKRYDCADDTFNPEKSLIMHECRAKLYEELKKLNDNEYRVCVLLLQKYSVRAIARELGINENTYKYQHKKFIKKMQKILGSIYYN